MGTRRLSETVTRDSTTQTRTETQPPGHRPSLPSGSRDGFGVRPTGGTCRVGMAAFLPQTPYRHLGTIATNAIPSSGNHRHKRHTLTCIKNM